MRNVFPTFTYIYDRYKKATPKRRAVIELRVSYARRQKYISTGINVYPKEWKDGHVVNSPYALQLNQELDRLMVEVRQILIDMTDNGGIDLHAITEKLSRSKQRQPSLMDFLRERANVREYGKEEDTKERYERFLRLFEEWGGMKSFDDVTEANVILYDQNLASKGMKDKSKWHNYHRFLNSFILDAIDAGYLKKNPYKWVNIEKGNDSSGLSRLLSPEEFERIQKVKLPTECLEKVRDVFVFQTYTCLSYIELKHFNPEKIVAIKGMQVYTGKRDKTGKVFTVPLLPAPLSILRKYEGILPVISNVKYNQYLKVIAQAAGIDKPVSTHWARHTGATILLNAGVPMQIVSKICGHSSTRITEQVYAKLLDETVVEAIKKLQKKKPPTNKG